MRKIVAVFCAFVLILCSTASACPLESTRASNSTNLFELDYVVSTNEIDDFMIEHNLSSENGMVISAGYVTRANASSEIDVIPCFITQFEDDMYAATFAFDIGESEHTIQPAASGIAPISFSKITLNVTVYYTSQSNSYGYKITRLSDVEAYFQYKNGYNASNTVVSNLDARAALFGALVPYPDCLSMNYNALMSETIDDNYHEYADAMYIGTLTANRIYGSEHTMSSTEAVWIPSSLHGGLTVTAWIMVDGTLYEDSVSIF